MNQRMHRTPAIRRNAGRIGLLTAGCLAALAVAAPAGAAPLSGSPGRGVAVVHTRAYAHANRAHPDQYQDTFTVRQLGTVIGAAVDNRAVALSAGCAPGRPCRSVALSFQIVTLAGDDVRLGADNAGQALNDHCAGCQTLAGAYQFVISTPRPFTLSAQALRELEAIHRQLDEAPAAGESIAAVHAHADALADQVMAVLRREAAAAPQGLAADPRALSAPPAVTMHRHFDQRN